MGCAEKEGGTGSDGLIIEKQITCSKFVSIGYGLRIAYQNVLFSDGSRFVSAELQKNNDLVQKHRFFTKEMDSNLTLMYKPSSEICSSPLWTFTLLSAEELEVSYDGCSPDEEEIISNPYCTVSN